MHNKLWGEFTDLFPNFNVATVDILEWISDYIPHFIMNVFSYPLHFLLLDT